MKVLDGVGQFAANGAAETAGLQQHHGVVDALDEMVVESHFAEFVDQHRGVAERRVGKQTRQQRRLARPQETGQKVDGREQRYFFGHQSSSATAMKARSSGSQTRPQSRSAAGHK
ncbi:hypothetical protein D9M70_479800 [compost metagenome]